MRLSLCITAILGGLSPSFVEAQTDWAAYARTAFDSHLEICGAALADPNRFVDTLASTFPAGTYDARTTPDGRIFRVTISTEAGRFATHYSRYLMNDVGHENCATYMQDPQTFEVDAQPIADGYRAVATELLGPDGVVGGAIAEMASSYGGGSDNLIEQTELHEFALVGLVGGQDVMSFTHAMGGFLSIVSQRDLRRPDALQARIIVPAAFADHCFSPLLTAATAAQSLPARHDFYDLDPLRAGNPISPAAGRPITPGTDRRCEVAFDGDDLGAGIAGVLRGLSQEGISTEADVPPDFPLQDGAEFVAARQLNPNRIAVVQVGTRPGANGPETFINVERLLPLED